MDKQQTISGLLPIGWREWVAFPDWGIQYLKAKVDTGARTSSLHAHGIEFFSREGKEMVRFTVLPWQNSEKESVVIESEVVSYKTIKSSSGCLEERPVILADIKVAGIDLKAELTLTNRDQMGFRMLLGRVAIRKRFIVVAGRSFLGGRPPKSIVRKSQEQ